MSTQLTGTSVAWRAPISDLLSDLADSGSLRFTEVVAENMTPGALPDGVTDLRARGVAIVAHGVSLGLAGADLPDLGRLRRLAELARELESPVVSEHIAFVRSADSPDPLHGDVLEAGHLLPPPRTRAALTILCDNISRAQDAVGVPLALENIAALIAWPEDEFDEPDYLAEIVRRTGAQLVLDVANLFSSAVAQGTDPLHQLLRFPLSHIAYVHTAGGRYRHGRYVDTHGDPMVDDVTSLLTQFVAGCHRARVRVPGIMLERDTDIRPETVLPGLRAIDAAIEEGRVHEVDHCA